MVHKKNYATPVVDGFTSFLAGKGHSSKPKDPVPKSLLCMVYTIFCKWLQLRVSLEEEVKQSE